MAPDKIAKATGTLILMSIRITAIESSKISGGFKKDKFKTLPCSPFGSINYKGFGENYLMER
jgi:hypothetical protein